MVRTAGCRVCEGGARPNMHSYRRCCKPRTFTSDLLLHAREVVVVRTAGCGVYERAARVQICICIEGVQATNVHLQLALACKGGGGGADGWVRGVREGGACPNMLVCVVPFRLDLKQEDSPPHVPRGSPIP